MFRLSGIHRDVYLIATPKVRLRDFHLISTLTEQLNKADLKVNVDVHNYGTKSQNVSVRISLLDDQGKQLGASTVATNVIAAGKEVSGMSTISISRPELWSAETPNLYTVNLELLDTKGSVLESTTQQYDFCKIEIRHNTCYV